MVNYLDNKINELMEISMKMKRYFHHNMNLDGSTMLQLETLLFIFKSSGTTMKNLAENLKISMSSATQLIDRLIASKFVERVFDEDDRRIIRLKITESGAKEIIERKEKMRLLMVKLYSALTEAELEQCIKIQKKLLNSIDI